MILPHFTAKQSLCRHVSMATHIKMQTLLKTVIVSATFALLSACQQLPLSSHSQTEDKTAWQQKAYAIGQANCLKNSSYSHPQVSGKIIDTEKYMLITMLNQQHTHASANNTTGKGELCIVSKQNGDIDITAIDRLRFLEGIQ